LSHFLTAWFFVKFPCRSGRWGQSGDDYWWKHSGKI